MPEIKRVLTLAFSCDTHCNTQTRKHIHSDDYTQCINVEDAPKHTHTHV